MMELENGLAAKEHREPKKGTEELSLFLLKLFVFSAFFCG
jgi:hypothetical protein